jgi:uncharacterized membrane protein YdbT with pleckstrin-like domain
LAIIAQFATLIVGIISLVWGYYEAGYPLIARLLAGFGLLWLVTQVRRWRWFSGAGFLITLLAAAVGQWIGAAIGWMVVGVVGGLLSWDLGEFRHRLAYADEDDDIHGLERRHLARVTIVAVIGTLLGTLVMVVQVRFTLEWGILLGIVAAWGVSQMVSWIKRGGK